MNRRPETSEYAPFYQGYIALVPGSDIIKTVEDEGRSAATLFSSLREEQGTHRYAPGKWSIKEVVGHVIDTERIQAYRALRIARNDKTNLPGFEQDDYIPFSNANSRSFTDLTEEFASVRRASVLLLKSFDDAAWDRMGRANNFELTARAIAYIIAGHELHHRKALREKYLTAATI